MTVSPLVEVLGENFAKYMEALKPSLIIGLQNVAEHQVTIFYMFSNKDVSFLQLLSLM
jgi:hypothetical protein